MYIEYAKKKKVKHIFLCLFFRRRSNTKLSIIFFFRLNRRGQIFCLPQRATKVLTPINSPLFRMIIKTLSNDVIILIYDISYDRKIISIFFFFLFNFELSRNLAIHVHNVCQLFEIG